MYMNGQAENMDEEIRRYTNLLRHNLPDIVFMGIGENGHIAFNDPHVAHFDDRQWMRTVELDQRCRQQQVNDGCFQTLEQVPTHALTLTVPALTVASTIFCMVPAAAKADAVGQTVLGEIRETLPASILRLHPQATLYIDSDSGRDVIRAFSNKAEL
ncbi:Glucosamine-6-phosphate deaminase 1 [bioreactor metagenome]|uniref:Glucosamine-6-phosphate deaminase 1 n=1 Tax=bioreactor metagenome TaxID=1076179 RepID=A0A645HZQ8_9ZZZZ